TLTLWHCALSPYTPLFRSYNNIYTQIITILTIACITTIKYADAINENNKEHMKLMLLNLESDDDVEAISLFAGIESRIKQDERRSEEHTSELQSRENLVCR